jgi:hypothetical protein
MEDRYYWSDILLELRRVLIRSEDVIKKKYAAQYAGKHPQLQAQKQAPDFAGIWIEQLTPGTSAAATAFPGGYGLATPPPAVATDQTNVITLVFRAVDLSPVDPGADNEIVYAVENELKAAPVFDPKSVQPLSQISPVDSNGTFTFTITVSPQNPLKLQL